MHKSHSLTQKTIIQRDIDEGEGETSSQGRVGRSGVPKVLLGWGGNLKWLHPPPKGFKLEREQERKTNRQRHQNEREKCLFHYVPP